MAKRVFKQKEWQYEEKLLDKEPILREELQQRLGESPRTVPQIFINNEYIGGYDKLVEWIDNNQI
jgi:glutaredoxin 3